MQKYYSVKDKETLEQLLVDLAVPFSLQEKRRQTISACYYDTFSWLLYEKGWILCQRGRNFILVSLGEETEQWQEKGPQGQRFFCWDFAQGPFREKLAELSAIRALLPVLQVRAERVYYSLVNGDEKTVVRLCCERSWIRTEHGEIPAPALVSLNALRGYENAFTHAAAEFEACEGSVAVSLQEIMVQRLALAGRMPLDYSSKYDLPLRNDLSVQTAISQISLYLAGFLLKNYHGVLDDIDTEFLHDFRVSLRRARSLFSQLKKYIPAQQISRFTEDFQWLGAVTGPVRDIDVYLLERKQYTALLPPVLHRGLGCFFEDLQRQRKIAVLELKTALSSARYEAFLQDWQSFFTQFERHIFWEKGQQPMMKIAGKRIEKRFKKMAIDGAALHPGSEDYELHGLRIQGKKLRYLIEFFKSYYDDDELSFFIKQLKKLQSVLGECNDLSVQQEMLCRSLTCLKGKSRRSLDIAAALGGLLVQLHQKHQQLRQQSLDAWQEFAADDNIDRFTALFR